MTAAYFASGRLATSGQSLNTSELPKFTSVYSKKANLSAAMKLLSEVHSHM